MPSLTNIPRTTFLIAFLMALHLGLPLYVNSSFLGSVIDEKFVGILFTIGATLTLILYAFIPKLLTRFGNHALIATILGVNFVILFFLPHLSPPLLVVLLFTLYLSTSRLLPFHYDIFVERLSTDETTGGIRGLYFTALNLGILVSPLISGLLVDEQIFWKVYLLTSILTIPLLALTRHTFKHFADPHYPHIPYFSALRSLMRRSNLRNIFFASFL